MVSLVLERGLSVSEALRQVGAGTDGRDPERVSRTAADTALRRERQRQADGSDVPSAAARILKLASRELAALEAETGPRDLDRLHKLAQILGTVERLRPKDARGAEETGLLALAEEGSNGASSDQSNV